MVLNVAYLRVSKKEEKIENQRKAIEDATKGEELIYFPDTESGAVPPLQRKKFQEMFEYIEKMKPEKLYVYEISRIGRTMMETFEIIQKIEKNGTMVIPISDKEKFLATTDKSIRNLILAVFAWMAQREREMLIERTRAGIERAKSEGKRLGRPPTQINWNKVDEYIEKGLSISAISILMNIPYPTLVRRIHQRKKQDQGSN